jgi:hypothetical protein
VHTKLAGITFLRYAQNKKNLESQIILVSESSTPKGLNRKANLELCNLSFQVIPITDGNKTQVLVVVNIDYNLAFSISALVSFRDSYLPMAIDEGWHGSRDDTRANMENMYCIFNDDWNTLSINEECICTHQNNNKINKCISQQYNSLYLSQLLSITFQYKSTVPILIICAMNIYYHIFLNIWVWEWVKHHSWVKHHWSQINNSWLNRVVISNRWQELLLTEIGVTFISQWSTRWRQYQHH